VEKADLVTEMVYQRQGQEPPENRAEEDPLPTEVVTGKGKGKTTYCLGRALIESCLGIPAMVIQFIKSPKAYGEVRAVERFPLIRLKTMGEGFLDEESKKTRRPNKKHLKAARLAWEECLKTIFSSNCRLAVLDEINVATYYGLASAARVREMIFLKPRDLHLILSGRNADPEVMEEAEKVIEMREIKHPFHKGVKARKGVEF
jgi:cob(I)alamin adenosyltransferase